MSRSGFKQKKTPLDSPRFAKKDFSGGCLKDVVDKLRCHKDYKCCSEIELRQRAVELTSSEELRAVFSHLTDLPFEKHAAEIAKEAELSQSLSGALLKAIGKLRPPSIKLHLFELKRPVTRFMSRFSSILSLHYGPLHAAIQIEDIVLQWSTSSLVIPKTQCDSDVPLFTTNVNTGTFTGQVAMGLQAQVAGTAGRLDCGRQLDLQYDLAVSVEEMIERVKKVIIKYNKFRQYNLFSCNCQTFVDDVMKEIGVKNAPQILTGKLKDYFKHLTSERSKTFSDFVTHQKLDEYVAAQDLSGMTQHNKEYLLCLYFRFHLEDMRTEKDADMKCQVEGCLMERVELSLETLFLQSYVPRPTSKSL